jgi:hypothetical protein
MRGLLVMRQSGDVGQVASGRMLRSLDRIGARKHMFAAADVPLSQPAPSRHGPDGLGARRPPASTRPNAADELFTAGGPHTSITTATTATAAAIGAL